MTVLHYAGIWLYIDEPEPAPNDGRSFSLTADEWREIKKLDAVSAKFTLHVKKIVDNEIDPNNDKPI